MVSFTTRDVTGKRYTPYIGCKEEKSVVNIKHTLYNIDSVGDTAVVVEGPTDVWNMGDGFVATFGTVYTPEQVCCLIGIKRLFILYDGEEEAIKMAYKLAYDASTFIPDVEVLELDEGDPGKLGGSDVRVLRRELFGKIY